MTSEKAIELLERAIEILDTMDSMEDNPIELCCNTEALKGIIPEALALLKPAVCEMCKGSGIIKPEGAPRSNQQALPYLQLCPDCKPAGSGQAEVGEKQLIIVRPRGIGKMVEWVKKLRPEVHIQESDCQKKLQQQQADIDRLEAERTQAIKLLKEALPLIVCENDFQSGLITAIGEFLQGQHQALQGQKGE